MRLRRTSAWRALCHIPDALRTHRRDLVSVTCSSSSRPPPREVAKLFSSPMVREWWVNAAQEAVISRKAISRAERIVTEADDPRSGKRHFYDSDARLCLVCNARLEGSYSTHSHSVDHKPRVALLKRTIGMILTFLEQAASSPSLPPPQESDSSYSLAGSKRFSRSVSTHTGTPAAPAPSCFHALYAESPLFAEDGVPSRALLYHRPLTLREFDLVDVIMRRWWNTLHNPPPRRGSLSFDRLLSLSSTELQMRRWRVRYLLHFLKSRGVLRSCLTLRSDQVNEAPSPNERIHRGEAFERLEMVGDFFFKSLTPDRMHTVFPADEGGLTAELQYFERALDSNHGLLAIYDYLGLDDIAGCFLANNKAKADVVEAVIGELKVLLWSTEVVWGMEYYAVPGERATHVYLRALVAHTIAELGHTVLMWQLESTLRNCRDFILKHTVEEYLGAEKGNERRASGGGDECDVPADLPKYAPLPPLLAWNRRRPGVSVRRGEVPFASKRSRSSIPPSPQDPLRRLAPTASCIPEAIRDHYAVGRKKWSSCACKAAIQALCGSLTQTALQHGNGHTADALSSNSTSASLPLSPQPQPSPTAPASAGAPRSVLRTLVTANCVVIRNSAPLLARNTLTRRVAE
ncbi:MP67 / RNA editing endoribonuclease (KREN3) [Leishmania donovani]|nr:MP67 / RNA editing endoribonuclease (KREN3) [Leishmania donovani]